jgi:pyruvate dehydrogenase E2 component (dihydrolipoamide acetyltransferase)
MAGELGIDLATVTGTGPRGQVTREDIEAHLKAAATAAPAEAGVRAVPAARRLARELEVDLRRVRGTGPGARIQSEDVRAFHARLAESPAAMVGAEAQPAPSVAGAPAVRRLVPLTNIRRTIADRMTASVREAPQFNVAVEAT